MQDSTKLSVISKYYGGQRTADILNDYFGTDRFFYKYGLLRGCVEIWINGKLEKAEIEKYQFFINGLMVGINHG